MKKGTLLLLLFLAFCLPVFSQKKITKQPQYWLRYAATFNFPSKTSLLMEAESRRYFEEKGFAAAFLRGQIQVTLKNNFAFDAAAACFYFYGQNYSEAELKTHPHYLDLRFHQSILLKQIAGKFSVTNRLRLEERFVQQQRTIGIEEFDLLPRLRLALLINYSLGEKWEIHASNDAVFNVFQKNTPNVFDRNLFGLALFHRFSAHASIEFGYLNQFISRPAQGEYLMRNIVRAQFSQQFNVKKKEGKS